MFVFKQLAQICLEYVSLGEPPACFFVHLVTITVG